MSVTPANVKNKLHEFDTVDEDRIQLFIDEAESQTNRCAFGGKADDAVIYLVGHLLKMDELESAANTGPLQSITVGPLSKSFAVAQMMEDGVLGSTIYGRRYLNIQRQLFVPRVF